MSEAEEIRGLVPQFLRVVLEISLSQPSKIVGLDQVAEHLNVDDLGTTGPDYVEKLSSVARYLDQRGFLESKGGSKSSAPSMFSITNEGIEWLEQQDLAEPSPPAEQRIAVPYWGPGVEPPARIRDSLQAFQVDYPDPDKVAFIMMRFGATPAHGKITEAVKSALRKHGIVGVRVDDKEYNSDMFANVETYMHGCGLGVAVFERLEADDHNPNVALEIGHLFAMEKPVCLLKDRTLKTLQADLVSKLYREFDPQTPEETIPPVVSKWLSDKHLT